MPTNRRQRRYERRRPLELSPRAIARLESGHDFSFLGPEVPDDADLRALWKELGAELSPKFIAEHPGKRCWAAWRFDLLPKNPRGGLDDDPDLEPTTTDPPWGNPWESGDGYESSFAYLSRRGLLEPGETVRIAEKFVHAIGPQLEFQRQQVHRVEEKYRGNVGFQAAELATIADIFGDGVLTADELRVASPYRTSNGRQ